MKPFEPPKPLIFAQSMAFSIDHLFYAWERREDRSRDTYYNPLRREMLLGTVVPDFQRSKVWTEDQNRALIRSIWRGIPIGTYSLNFSISQKTPPDLTNILIDGQQRLNALRGYWENEFDFNGYFWGDLEDNHQRKFISRPFPQQRTDSTDRQEVLDYYNAMNFGGVAHDEQERAA